MIKILKNLSLEWYHLDILVLNLLIFFCTHVVWPWNAMSELCIIFCFSTCIKNKKDFVRQKDSCDEKWFLDVLKPQWTFTGTKEVYESIYTIDSG